MSDHNEPNHAADGAACQPDSVRGSELTGQCLLEVPLFWVVASMGLANSNGDARRLIRGGGVILNGICIKNGNCPVKAMDIITVSKNGQLKQFPVTSELMQRRVV